MRHFRIAYALGASVLLASSVFADEPTLDLRPRFVPGQENRFVVDMHSRSQTQFLDRTRVRLQEYQQRIRVKRRVVETGDTGATLELKYESVVVNLVAGNKLLTFDSEGINIPEAEETLGQGTRDALSLVFTVKVDPLGRVLSVTGNEPEVSKQAATNLIGEEVLGQAMAPIYGLAKDPSTATAGETWTTTRTGAASQTGVFTTTISSNLTNVSDGRATVTITGTLSLEPSAKAKEGKAELVSHDIRGEQVWNVLDSVIDRSAYKQVMEVQADVEGRGPLQEKGEIRRRKAETLQQVVITRVDEGMTPLPPLATELAPIPVTAPDEPPTGIAPSTPPAK